MSKDYNVRNLFLLFCFIFSVNSCSDRKDMFPIIKASGNYELKPTEFKLRVRIKKQLVDVTILNSNGEVIVENNDASNTHRWALFWDESTKLLWLTSGDIGQMAWDLNEERPVKQTINKESKELIKRLPRQIAEEMPDSLRRLFGIDN